VSFIIVLLLFSVNFSFCSRSVGPANNSVFTGPSQEEGPGNQSTTSVFFKSVPSTLSLQKQQIELNRKRLLRKKKKKLKDSKKAVVPVLPPIAKDDPRRFYAKHLLSAFNSCDVNKLTAILNSYTTDDLVSLYRHDDFPENSSISSCEGDSEEGGDGNIVSTFKGRQSTIQMWISLFQSTPDFFFEIVESTAAYGTDKNVVITSKFVWTGTKIMDVRIFRDSQKHDNLIVKKKLLTLSSHLNKEKRKGDVKVSTDEEGKVVDINTVEMEEGDTEMDSNDELTNSLLHSEDIIIVEQMEQPFHEKLPLNCSGSDHCMKVPRTDDCEESLGSTSCYTNTSSCSASFDGKKEMKCHGNLILYLNKDNKIHKIEFICTGICDLGKSF
jgi:hypothetical protein